MDSLIAIGTSAALVYGIFAIFKIGYGLGLGQMDIVMAYSMDLYFESARNDFDPRDPRKIIGIKG